MNLHTPERRDRTSGSVDSALAGHQLDAMIVGTYREMPGLSLHLTQAARLFGASAQECQIVLDDLVRLGHLRRASDGQYRYRQASF
jgi:hypothetical protein